MSSLHDSKHFMSRSGREGLGGGPVEGWGRVEGVGKGPVKGMGPATVFFGEETLSTKNRFSTCGRSKPVIPVCF